MNSNDIDDALFSKFGERLRIGCVADALVMAQLITKIVNDLLVLGHSCRSPAFCERLQDFRAVDVPENFVEPDAASKKQIAADEMLKNRAFSHLIAAPQWSGNFVTPVTAKPTDSFGMTRVFNEELSSTHRGTDFPVNEGAPVVVSNSGTVVLAKELFYEGNCVIVDHGQRFFTIYMHLSKIEVKAGNKLGKGERLGLSGQTGRVTGPHLHMGVRWNGAYLDPTKLLELTLPKLGPEKRRPMTRARHTARTRPPA
jgi:murein DD-endopeptidase MepM/ murein hydrolase activator NlpD